MIVLYGKDNELARDMSIQHFIWKGGKTIEYHRINRTGTFSSISGSPTPTTSLETRPRIWPKWPGSFRGPVSKRYRGESGYEAASCPRGKWLITDSPISPELTNEDLTKISCFYSTHQFVLHVLLTSNQKLRFSKRCKAQLLYTEIRFILCKSY